MVGQTRRAADPCRGFTPTGSSKISEESQQETPPPSPPAHSLLWSWRLCEAARDQSGVKTDQINERGIFFFFVCWKAECSSGAVGSKREVQLT